MVGMPLSRETGLMITVSLLDTMQVVISDTAPLSRIPSNIEGFGEESADLKDEDGM